MIAPTPFRAACTSRSHLPLRRGGAPSPKEWGAARVARDGNCGGDMQRPKKRVRDFSSLGR